MKIVSSKSGFMAGRAKFSGAIKDEGLPHAVLSIPDGKHTVEVWLTLKEIEAARSGLVAAAMGIL